MPIQNTSTIASKSTASITIDNNSNNNNDSKFFQATVIDRDKSSASRHLITMNGGQVSINKQDILNDKLTGDDRVQSAVILKPNPVEIKEVPGRTDSLLYEVENCLDELQKLESDSRSAFAQPGNADKIRTILKKQQTELHTRLADFNVVAETHTMIMHTVDGMNLADAHILLDVLKEVCYSDGIYPDMEQVNILKSIVEGGDDIISALHNAGMRKGYMSIESGNLEDKIADMNKLLGVFDHGVIHVMKAPISLFYMLRSLDFAWKDRSVIAHHVDSLLSVCFSPGQHVIPNAILEVSTSLKLMGLAQTYIDEILSTVNEQKIYTFRDIVGNFGSNEEQKILLDIDKRDDSNLEKPAFKKIDHALREQLLPLLNHIKR